MSMRRLTYQPTHVMHQDLYRSALQLLQLGKVAASSQHSKSLSHYEHVCVDFVNKRVLAPLRLR